MNSTAVIFNDAMILGYFGGVLLVLTNRYGLSLFWLFVFVLGFLVHFTRLIVYLVIASNNLHNFFT